MGQVIEKGVLNWLVALKIAERGVPTQGMPELWGHLEKSTLGRLLKMVRDQVEVSPDMDEKLEAALDRRNYLAHHFFFSECSLSMGSEDGRRSMIEELQGLIRQFKSADELVDAVSLPLWEKLGVTQAMIDVYVGSLGHG